MINRVRRTSPNIGLARAADLARQEMPTEAKRLTGLRGKLAKLVLDNVKDAWINGTMTNRVSQFQTNS